MRYPALSDTIVAVSSQWQAAPLGIIRISGPEALPLLRRCAPDFPPSLPGARWRTARLAAAPDVWVRGGVLLFRAPRSYTGQDLVELHVPGSLPLLRQMSGRFIEWGARRALPGEFTARAFLDGKLSSDQVHDVLSLLQPSGASPTAARQVGEQRARLLARVNETLADLLARIEAGIDFVEEEDIRFITPAEVRQTLAALAAEVEASAGNEREILQRTALPRVALAGLPNAGKSQLFNALLGQLRALVSPVVGTTRDVLSAELQLGDYRLMLQDCAGLGSGREDLDLATYRASERAIDRAELVLWVHDVTQPWAPVEEELLSTLPAARRILVFSKSDLQTEALPPKSWPGPAVSVSAARGDGLSALGAEIAQLLSEGNEHRGFTDTPVLGEIAASLRRLAEMVDDDEDTLVHPELLSLDLRDLLAGISQHAAADQVEQILGRIFSQFCVGK